MQTSNASDTVAGTRDGRINYFLVSIGVTILYYDYTITIGAEYLYVWRSWSYFRSKACICLLLARYFPLFGTLVMLCGYLFAFDEGCSNLAVCHEVVLIITQVLVAVIQFLRTYALYCKQKRIVAFLICSVAAGIAVNVWAMISQPGNILVQQGCYFTSSTTSAIHTAVQWEVALAYDASIFLLTLFKTYDWQSYLKYGIRGPPNTISLMYRHGAIYFGFIVLAHGANVITFYVLPPSLRGCLSTVASVISVTMMSRLTLDLRGAAMRRRDDTPARSLDTATVHGEFTSEIDVMGSDDSAFDDAEVSDSDSQTLNEG